MTFSRKTLTATFISLLMLFILGINSVVASDYSHDDVRFRGMVFQADTTYTGYMTVKVFDSFSGKNLEGQKVRVGPFGVSRCNINVRSNSKISSTDHVEVYGLHEKVMYLEGPTIDVDLCHSNRYYIKKISEEDGDSDGGEDGGRRDGGTCKVDLSMNKKLYRPGEIAQATISTVRNLNYRLTVSGEERRPLEYGWTEGAGDMRLNFTIKRPQGRKHLIVEAADKQGRGCSDEFRYQVRVERNEKPEAECNFYPKSPEVNERIEFDGSYSDDPDGHIVNYNWDIGADGSVEVFDEINIFHTFREPGYHRVRLIVEDDAGRKDSDMCSLKVEEENRSPTAKIDYQPQSPATEDTIIFSASNSYDPDGKIVTRKWDFDNDGSTDTTGINAAHDFKNPGIHEVNLMVLDNEGGYDQQTVRIPVKSRNKINITVQDNSGNSLDAKIFLNGQYKATTGKDGHATIKELRSGKYTIKADKDAYTFQTREVILNSGVTKYVTIRLTHRAKAIANMIDGWSYESKALRKIEFDNTEFQIHLLRNESGFISYLPLSDEGELPASSENFLKITTATSFVNTSRPNSIKSDAEFFHEMADKFLAVQFAGETLIKIRNTASSLLGDVLSTYATGGASAITKEVGSSTIKQTTKHFAKKFAKSLAKNMVQGNLNVKNSIKAYAKGEILASKNACSGAINIITNNHPLDDENLWSLQEFERVKDKYESCAVKLIPSMHLLSDLNPDGDVFSQLQDVSSKVVEGATGVDPQLLYDLLVQDIEGVFCNGLCQALRNYAGMKAGIREKALDDFNTKLEKKSAEDILSELQRYGYYPIE